MNQLPMIMNSTGAVNAVNSINAEGELLLYGAIGEWWDDLDAESVVNQLERISSGDILVRIHSAGGYITEGLAIYNALKHSTKKVIVHIDGLAASMASVVAMAGDTIIMPDNALMMIHKPWMSASGDAEELRRNADMLDKMEESLLSIYHGKTGLDNDVLAQMLTSETWMNGNDALEQGFVDQVIQSLSAAASIDLSRVNPPQDKLALLFPNQAPYLTSQNQENSDMNSASQPAAPTQQPAASTPGAVQPSATPVTTPTQPADSTTPAVQAAANTAAEQAVAAERSRVQTLNTIGTQARLENDVINGWITEGVSVDNAREQALNLVAERDASNAPTSGHITFITGDTTNLRGAITTSMLNRVNPSQHALDEESGQFRGMTFMETARAFIEMTGGVARGKNKNELIAMAMHSTSDFPLIIGDVAERTLQAAYSESVRNFTPFSRQSNAMDFRQKHSLQIGGGQGLEEVKPNGEYQRGTVSEGKEGYKLATFGRIFNFSRQLMINDDLGALIQFISELGRLATRKELDVVYSLITSNPVMSDGVPIFHADHNNLVEAGTGVTEQGLSSGRQLMRKQRGLDDERINVSPSIVLVGSERETEAEKQLATVIANQTEGVNPFAGTQQLIVESRLDDVANNPWYQFSLPSVTPAIEWAYLEGEEGPRIETRSGFEVDGMEVKVGHDFGAGWVNHRGAVKNSGTGA